MGLVGPLVFFAADLAGGRPRADRRRPARCWRPTSACPRSASNAFGVERRGVALLLAFPLARWRVLVGKNLGGDDASACRRLLVLAIAGVAGAAARSLPAALTIALARCWSPPASTTTSRSSSRSRRRRPARARTPARRGRPRPRRRAPQRGAVPGGALALWRALRRCSPWLPRAGRARLLLVVDRAAPGARGRGRRATRCWWAGPSALLLRREPELLERILGEA